MKYAYGVPCGLAAGGKWLRAVYPPRCCCIATALLLQADSHTETPRPFRGLAREDPESFEHGEQITELHPVYTTNYLTLLS